VTDLSSFPAVADLITVQSLKKAGPAPQAGPTILNEVDFLGVIRSTPLVAIDLIVNDGNRRVLLGHRKNRPARGTWFVPGGRITKGETLDAAFTRIVQDELGIASVQRSSARFRGVFEHFLDENFAGVPGISTHYVVLAYSLTLGGAAPIGRFDQHSNYTWAFPAELLSRADVHDDTKGYFR
jgi:colanic acid biosynthesis protein WcaH